MKNNNLNGPRSDEDIRTLVHLKEETAELTKKVIRRLQSDKGGGVPTGFAELDAVMRPLRPGDLCTVLGYTSHLKSFFMNYMAFEEANRIKARQNDDQMVIKVTWEQSVEEDTLAWISAQGGLKTENMVRGFMGEADWKLMDKIGMARSLTPVVIVGHSLEESIQSRRARPRMTMTDVAMALDLIVNKIFGRRMEPRLIVLDYLQRVRPDPADGDNRREQMMEIVNRAKDCAISFGCPVMLGVQTGRDKDAKGEEHIPRIDSGQETSGIEQASDVMYGTWYPIKTEKYGESCLGGIVGPDLMILRALKQKLGGSAPHTFAMKIDPTCNRILAGRKVK